MPDSLGNRLMYPFTIATKNIVVQFCYMDTALLFISSFIPTEQIIIITLTRIDTTLEVLYEASYMYLHIPILT